MFNRSNERGSGFPREILATHQLDAGAINVTYPAFWIPVIRKGRLISKLHASVQKP
jgi:hypothetical protein